MVKKLSLLIAAIAVLAFAVPAMASASTGLTANGTLLTTGSQITGTNTETITTTTSIGNITCAEVMLLGEVTENSETTGVTGVGIGEGSATTCFWKGTIPIQITHIQLTDLSSSMSESGTGKGSFSFEADLKPGELTCKYVGTGSAGSYVPGSDVISFLKAKLVATPAACGTASLDGAFTLSTTGGTAVNIM